MTLLTSDLPAVTKLIQLSIAPIFLLTAVATTLTLLAGRLARIVDRGRMIEAGQSTSRRDHVVELKMLEKRAKLIYYALALGVSAAIMVCLLMTSAFLGEVVGFNAAAVAGFLFLGALFAYTGALLCLLREFFLAIGTFRLVLPPKEA